MAAAVAALKLDIVYIYIWLKLEAGLCVSGRLPSLPKPSMEHAVEQGSSSCLPCLTITHHHMSLHVIVQGRIALEGRGTP